VREVEAALLAFREQLDQARDPTDHDKLFVEFKHPEKYLVDAAVESLAIEVGLEAGEVLLGKVASPKPFAGLRHRLKEAREIETRGAGGRGE
jgi:hypothetical protein